MDRRFGWDLPPGVSVNDLPGNRPEDIEEDAFWNELDKKLAEAGMEIADEHYDADWFQEAIRIARDLGYNRGYVDADDEIRMQAIMDAGEAEGEYVGEHTEDISYKED